MVSVHLTLEDHPLYAAEALLEANRPDEAAALLRGWTAAGHGGLTAHILLARALLASDRHAEALAVAREAAHLHAGAAAAALMHGQALLANGVVPSAIAEFQRALRLDPALTEAKFQLGCAWLEAGEAERALAAFADLEDGTAGDLLAEKIAEAEALRAAPRANARYVQHLFDQFAANYDAQMLGPLAYRAPAILRELADLVIGPRTGLDLLDLGCGTGLAGLAFAGRAARLDGIDLAPQMIEKARSRGLYSDLAVADIEAWLASDGRCYDLIVAADTVVYLGDLAPMLAGIRGRLKPGGFFLFTAEKAEGTGFELGPKRRWRHSEAYLRAAAAAAGLDLAGLIAASPRQEANVPVDGYAVALTNPG